MEKSNIILWEVRDNIGILTIDNPPQNYLLEPDFLELSKIKEWTGEESLRGIIITGRGRHFSAGGDISTIKRLARDPELLLSKLARGKEILDFIDRIEIPTIAAIRGACFGGGLEIALACHMRVCGKNALFAFPETTQGLLPGLGGTVRLYEKTAFSTAMQMILSGDIVDADKAFELRLADHLVPSGQVLDFSFSLMKKMVEGKSKKVITYVVRALNSARTMSAREVMEEETKMFCDLAGKI
jgi:enoyl-CoA hydratase/carnithine racemase